MSNLYAPPRAAVLDIVEPEAALVLADRGARLGASILDSFIPIVMVIGPFIVFSAVGDAASTRESGSGPNAVAILGLVLALAGLVAWVWLTLRFVIRNGQSIGKKLLGIRVVRADGSRVSLGRLLVLRNAVVAALSVIPLFGFVDVLFIFSESRQCLHDKIADTIVVVA